MKFPSAYTSKSRTPAAVVTANDVLPLQVPTEAPTDLAEMPGYLDRIDTSWLPFAAKTYHISPRLADYVVATIPLCPSDLPNRNGVAFPIAELVKYQPPPMNRQVFKAWAGCPCHLEHDNEDCTKAVGVIFDTSLRQIKNYGDGKHWAVMGLVGIDKLKCPELAQRFLTHQINTGSMGAMADSFTCAVCGAEASENHFTNCPHITSTKDVNWSLVDHMGVKKIAYLNAHELSPIEYSWVADPAWVSCLSEVILKE